MKALFFSALTSQAFSANVVKQKIHNLTNTGLVGQIVEDNQALFNSDELALQLQEAKSSQFQLEQKTFFNKQLNIITGFYDVSDHEHALFYIKLENWAKKDKREEKENKDEKCCQKGLRAGVSLQLKSRTPFIAGDFECLTKEKTDKKEGLVYFHFCDFNLLPEQGVSFLVETSEDIEQMYRVKDFFTTNSQDEGEM